MKSRASWPLAMLALAPIALATGAADGSGPWSTGGDGGGWSSFHLASSGGDLRFGFDADAWGAASYGVDLFGEDGRRFLAIRIDGRDDGDLIAAGVAEFGAAVNVPQPVFAPFEWSMSARFDGLLCRGYLMTYYFAGLEHRFNITLRNCEASGPLRGIYYAAGETVLARSLEIEGAVVAGAENVDGSFFATLDDFDGVGAELRIEHERFVVAPPQSLTLSVEHGFFGSYSHHAQESNYSMSYASPESSAQCRCTISAPGEAGDWRFDFAAADWHKEKRWWVLGGVDARLPP